MDVKPSLKRNFGQEHFGHAQLGDVRRTRRLVQLADRLIESPGGTLPQRLRDHSELTAMYRLMDADAVTHGAVIHTHCQRTRQLMRQIPVVLIVYDNTELDYSSKKSLQNLGQIGNGGGHGYICHNALAITPQREVIGLAHQILHKRRQVPKGETPTQKRRHPDRESRLWVRSTGAIGPAPADVRWVDIADRGADTFEFLAHERRKRRHFVIRSAKDRKLAGDDHVGADRVYQTLYAYTRDLPDLGQRTVQMAAVAGGHAARMAQVRVAAGPVTIAIPQFVRGEAQEPSLDLWVIHVRETQAPAGVEALEWILLTDLACGGFAQSSEKIDWYECRPLIEEYHKGQKSGCRIESMQFESEERLEPAIGLLSVVAAVLLQLRQLARDPQAGATPAQRIVPTLYVQVLSAWRYRQSRSLSVLEFCMALGRLGGHLGRKGDGFPGWLTLWRGWEDLMLMVKGVQAIRGQDV